MALSTQVYTSGQAPNNVPALLNIISHRPDVLGAFSKGYDDQQKRELALQQYREAKTKADLAQALYPDLLASQQAALRARLAAYGAPATQYQSNPIGVGPVNTVSGNPTGSAPELTPPTDEGTNVAPSAPANVYPGNPFNGPSGPLFQQGPAGPAAAQPMISGLAGSSYDPSDFIG